MAICRVDLRCHQHLLGHGPQTAHQCPGHGHDHLVGVCAAGQQASNALAPPHVRLPTDVWDRLGERLHPELDVATDVGGIPGGPGAFDQGASGRRVPGCGARPLPVSRPTGICCGDQAEIFHQLSGIVDASQVAACGHEGHRDGELDAPQGLKRLDHWPLAPGVHVVLQFLLQTLQAFGVFVDRAHVFLEDNLLNRGRIDHFREPPEMGWAPGGPAGVADVVSEQKGFEPKLGGLEIADGIFTSAGEVTDGLIFHLGNINRGEVPRAHQAGQLCGITASGFHPVAGLFRNQ